MRSFIIIASLFALSSTAQAQEFKKYEATFHSCYDGDTCYFDFHLGANVGLGVSLGAVMPKQGVRLCDINAPEMRGGTAATKAEAKNVRDILVKWLKDARHVQVEIPQRNNCDSTRFVNCDKTEKYGRWLGYILADGVNLNQKMLDQNLVGLLISKRTGKPILCKTD